MLFIYFYKRLQVMNDKPTYQKFPFKLSDNGQHL